MAERAPAQDVILPSSLEGFYLRESLGYPNGGRSLFFVRGDDALIVDDGICEPPKDGAVFDYSLITNKQNAYVARYQRVFRLLREDLDQAEKLLRYDIEYTGAIPKRMPAPPSGA